MLVVKIINPDKVSVKSFSGATTKEISTFVKPSTEEKPDSVILNIGTYDLRSDDESDKIENDIINIATSCKQSGCDVIISALHPSWDKFNIKVKEANDSLKELFLLKNILLLEQHNFNARYQ